MHWHIDPGVGLIAYTLLAVASAVTLLATACYDLIQSRAAARERTPMKLEAVFS